MHSKSPAQNRRVVVLRTEVALKCDDVKLDCKIDLHSGEAATLVTYELSKRFRDGNHRFDEATTYVLGEIAGQRRQPRGPLRPDHVHEVDLLARKDDVVTGFEVVDE